jgi:hypothetical protein
MRGIRSAGNLVSQAWSPAKQWAGEADQEE